MHCNIAPCQSVCPSVCLLDFAEMYWADISIHVCLVQMCQFSLPLYGVKASNAYRQSVSIVAARCDNGACRAHSLLIALNGRWHTDTDLILSPTVRARIFSIRRRDVIITEAWYVADGSKEGWIGVGERDNEEWVGNGEEAVWLNLVALFTPEC